jgi:hypothetical protein
MEIWNGRNMTFAAQMVTNEEEEEPGSASL